MRPSLLSFGIAATCIALCSPFANAELELSCNSTLPSSSEDDLSTQCLSICSIAEPVEEELKDDHAENVPLAFALVTGAGLSTTIGAATVFFPSLIERTNHKMLAIALGFSAGVMLYVSMAEIIIKSQDEFAICDCLWVDTNADPEDHLNAAFAMTTICFFCGILVTYMLDLCLKCINKVSGGKTGHGHSHNFDFNGHEGADVKPQHLRHDHVEVTKPVLTSQTAPTSVVDEMQLEDGETSIHISNTTSNEGVIPVVSFEQVPEQSETSNTTDQPQDAHKQVAAKGSIISESSSTATPPDHDLERLEHMSLMTALAIGLHNFPEGLATFIATLSDPSVGAALAVAIAIHNIPEGMCIAIPVYYASGSRWKGFWMAFWSGVTELIGAALGYFLLREWLGPAVYGATFGLVSGMMVGIVLKELLPTSYRYDPHDEVTTTSLFIGMFVMALSLIMFRL